MNKFWDLDKAGWLGQGASLVLHLAVLFAGGFLIHSAKLDLGLGAGVSVPQDMVIQAQVELEEPQVDQPAVQKMEIQKQTSTEPVGVRVNAKPNTLHNQPPLYPDEARGNHQEGVVQLLVKISGDGNVESLEIEKSSGYPLLDQSACKAVKNWKFIPATLGGAKIESEAVIPVRFQLSGE
ncbi:MAG: energy transducer TonB [Methylacidiphilales bacterium]|nr:energy transducer TonB [Candidatus Methylacidiphilales bacterium]